MLQLVSSDLALSRVLKLLANFPCLSRKLDPPRPDESRRRAYVMELRHPRRSDTVQTSSVEWPFVLGLRATCLLVNLHRTRVHSPLHQDRPKFHSRWFRALNFGHRLLIVLSSAIKSELRTLYLPSPATSDCCDTGIKMRVVR